MDGILGVGVAEVILVGLVLFIIGGPENTAKWARELGTWVRKLRKAWQQTLKQLEEELGEDGKEIIDATREFGNTVREVREIKSSRGLLGAALKPGEKRVAPVKDTSEVVESSSPAEVSTETAKSGAEPDAAPDSGADQAPAAEPDAAPVFDTAPASPDRYRAWLPPETQQD